MPDLPIVKEIAFTPVSVPLARPMRTASGTLPGAALGLIDVTTNAGITGHAFVGDSAHALAATPTAH